MALGTGSGTISLQGALVLTGILTVYRGTWNTNGYTITCLVARDLGSTQVRTFNLGASTITCTGTGNVWAFNATNLTIDAGTSIIIISNATATAKNFTGVGKTYATVTFSGDNIWISGDNTFATMNVNTAGLATGLIFTIDSIQTVTNFTTNGSVGNLAKILSSSAGSHFHLTTGSAQISVDYMSIKDSVADQANTWYAGANSTDVSGNSGWIFTAPPPPAAGGIRNPLHMPFAGPIGGPL